MLKTLSTLAVIIPLSLAGCKDSNAASKWSLVLSHDGQGNVASGVETDLVGVIRQGCQIRVGWGARRASDPARTIEHVATPIWISVRDSEKVEVQIGEFLANLTALGQPPEDHTRREAYGGVEHVVKWRATLKTNGSFDAVWYHPHNGKFVKRSVQNHPMRWYADCAPEIAKPLFPEKLPSE